MIMCLKDDGKGYKERHVEAFAFQVDKSSLYSSANSGGLVG